MRRIILPATLLILSSTGLAADTAGTWKGSIRTIAGISECILIIKTEGAKVSGTVQMDVYGADITDGKLDGEKLSFTVHMDFGTLTYEGIVSGNELRFIVSAPDGSYAPLTCTKGK